MPESKPTTPEAPEVEEVDESSDESFPASDPPSWAMGKRTEPTPFGGRDDPSPGGDRPSKQAGDQSNAPGARQG